MDDNTVLSLILAEGDNWSPSTLDPASYRASFHSDLLLPYVPPDTLLFNYLIIARDKLLGVGGLDCRFEQLSMADVDLSIRLRKFGLKEKITDSLVVKLEWMPGTSGDHAPVHNAHFEHDLPLFKKIYNDAESQQRCVIPLNNWINQPKKWVRRFGG
jgi:hypothetical protein